MSDEVLKLKLETPLLMKLVKGGGQLELVPNPGPGKRVMLMTTPSEAIARGEIWYKVVDA